MTLAPWRVQSAPRAYPASGTITRPPLHAARIGPGQPKSACTYCPFALTAPAGRNRVLALYLDQPDAAVRDLTLEHTALALNPRQGLAGRGTLAELLASTGRHDHLLARFRARLAALPWQVCDVRRTTPRARITWPLQCPSPPSTLHRVTAGTPCVQPSRRSRIPAAPPLPQRRILM